MKKNSYFVNGLVILSLVGTMAVADSNKESNDDNQKDLQIKSSIQIANNTNEIDEKNLSKINIQGAIKIIKKQFIGNVIDIKLENINGNLIYQAGIIDNNQITNVLVDAGNGKILASKVDKSDSKEESNEEENGNSESWYKFWD